MGDGVDTSLSLLYIGEGNVISSVADSLAMSLLVMIADVDEDEYCCVAIPPRTIVFRVYRESAEYLYMTVCH